MVKMKKRTWIAFVYLFFLLFITAVVEISYHNGYTFYRLESYAIDADGRVFIGKIGKIDIYKNNNLEGHIQLPVQHSYTLKFLPNNLIQLSKNDDIYYLSLNGDVIKTEKSSENVDRYSMTANIYKDTYGNSYEYSDSILGRKKIIKNGKEIVFIESRFNQIATIVKQWQFIEFLFAMFLFGGRGHPILFIKIAIKRISEGKIVYLVDFDKYYHDYYLSKIGKQKST